MFYASGRENVDYLEIKFNVRVLDNLDAQKTRLAISFSLRNYLS